MRLTNQLTAAGVAAACVAGVVAGVAAPAGAASASGVTIDLPTWWAPTQEIPPTQALYNNVFTKETGIKVVMQFVPSGDFTTKVTTAAASGNPYPVITADTNDLTEYARTGLITPLGPFVAKSHFNLNAYLPGVTSQLYYQGKLYGLTNDQGSYYLYYNANLFKAAGLPLPGPDFTWAQMLSDAQKLTTANHKVWGLDLYDVAGTPDIFARMNGQDIMNSSGTKFELTNPATEQAFSFFQSLVYKYHVAPAYSSTVTGAAELFADGDVGMMLDGSWEVDYLRYIKPKFSWDIGNLPVGPAAKGVVHAPIFQGVYMMSAGLSSQLQTAAWKLIQFYASPVFANQIMGVKLSSLPALKEELADPSAYDLWPAAQPQSLTKSFLTQFLANAQEMPQQGIYLTEQTNTDLGTLDEPFSTPIAVGPFLAKVQAKINADLGAKS